MLELEDINDSLRDIEKNIFDGHEGEMVAVISNLNRTLVDFKQAIRFHRETLRSFESAGTQFFGNEFSYYLSAITGEYNKVQNVLDGHKEILDDLKDTNDSLLTSKTNDTIKKLTIMTFIMLPLTLITGIFGMNSEIIFIKSLGNFGTVLLLMIVIGIVMFAYFKKKRWF
jgi:magnesium transporter